MNIFLKRAYFISNNDNIYHLLYSDTILNTSYVLIHLIIRQH